MAHSQIADNTWRLRLDCPAIAASSIPGQFAMIRIPNRSDPLLARPLAVYDTFVITGSADSSVRKWDMTTCECLFVYEGHTARVQK